MAILRIQKIIRLGIHRSINHLAKLAGSHWLTAREALKHDYDFVLGKVRQAFIPTVFSSVLKEEILAVPADDNLRFKNEKPSLKEELEMPEISVEPKQPEKRLTRWQIEIQKRVGDLKNKFMEAGLLNSTPPVPADPPRIEQPKDPPRPAIGLPQSYWPEGRHPIGDREAAIAFQAQLDRERIARGDGESVRLTKKEKRFFLSRNKNYDAEEFWELVGRDKIMNRIRWKKNGYRPPSHQANSEAYRRA